MSEKSSQKSYKLPIAISSALASGRGIFAKMLQSDVFCQSAAFKESCGDILELLGDLIDERFELLNRLQAAETSLEEVQESVEEMRNTLRSVSTQLSDTRTDLRGKV